MAKLKFGDKKGREFYAPEANSFVKRLKGESLFIFGEEEDKTHQVLCLGVGRVTYVQKGKEMDLVKINFGRHYARKIIVKHNHARRQIFSLVKGQLAWFYGSMKVYTTEDGIKTWLFAKGFQPWYVPKVMDIKHYDTDTFEELKQEEEKDMLHYLDLLTKENDDE